MKAPVKTRTLILIISITFLVFSLLAILAPVFAHFKWNFLSDPIYWFFQWFCHQRPWRSYHLFDYQFAIDARMITMFISIGIGGLITYFKKLPPLKGKYAFIFFVTMLIPMGIDGVTQLIAELNVYKVGGLPFYESTNLIRSITGIFAGTGLAFAFFPHLQSYYIEGFTNFKKLLKMVALNFLITGALIPVFAILWSLTSIKYLPSSFLIDNIQRYPGYNYEITKDGGHMTIERYFSTSTEIYKQRAIFYKKEQYLKECNPLICKSLSK